MQNKSKTKIKYLLVLIATVVAIAVLLNNSTSLLKLMYPLKYQEYVYLYSKQNDLNPYLVFSIIKAESSFNPSATSHKNARGLMQITDGTGKWVAEMMKIKEFDVNQLYDPELNIKMGCWYLHNLIEQFEDDRLAVAAYNGGRGNVSGWLKDRNLSKNGENLDKIPFKETDKYVKKVFDYYSVYVKLYDES